MKETLHKLVFCDEFGNTGAKLLQVDQPVFLYAFILINQLDLLNIKDRVNEIYQSEKLSLTELKSSKLVQSVRGRNRFTAIGEIIATFDTQIILSVVEKRYQACSMITETYLDPVLHENAPPEMLERKYRQMFTDACYEFLSENRLLEFLNVIKSDEPEAIAKLGKRFSLTLQFHPTDFVCYAAGKMETRSEHIFRYFERRPEVLGTKYSPASQYAGFFPGLQCVNNYLQNANTTGILIRDEDSQFGERLDLAFKSAQELDDIPNSRAYGAQEMLTCLKACKEASSSDVFGIQLADLAAGLFGRIALKALKSKTNPENLSNIVQAWSPSLLQQHNHYWMIADSKLGAVISRVYSE